MIDADNFVIGDPKAKDVSQLEVELPKTIEYLKKTGKRFDELTPEEIAALKPSE